MVAHGNEEIEEELAALFHLKLHCAATLKGIAAADDECEIVSSKLRVAVGCVRIGVAS